MTNLDDFAHLGRQEHGLAVISTVRADGSAQAVAVGQRRGHAEIIGPDDPHPAVDQQSHSRRATAMTRSLRLARKPLKSSRRRLIPTIVDLASGAVQFIQR